MQERGSIKSDKYPQECNVYNTQLEPQNKCKEYSLDIEINSKEEKGEESKAQSQPKSLVRKKKAPKTEKIDRHHRPAEYISAKAIGTNLRPMIGSAEGQSDVSSWVRFPNFLTFF